MNYKELYQPNEQDIAWTKDAYLGHYRPKSNRSG